MSNITAADVAKLRKSTGAGMMDCKKVLTEANGDMELVFSGLRPGEKIHEEMITSSDSFSTYVIGDYYSILPQTPVWNLEDYQSHFAAKPVPTGFRYNSGENENFLTVEELRKLIRIHVDPEFSV